ncbi:MAG: hypothetical protein JWN27_2939 [Candidatus Eremiobacteraeota bacterium]|nr:hypothetical protein [Candidatus Eremiobacteraeota bacterium]
MAAVAALRPETIVRKDLARRLTFDELIERALPRRKVVVAAPPAPVRIARPPVAQAPRQPVIRPERQPVVRALKVKPPRRVRPVRCLRVEVIQPSSHRGFCDTARDVRAYAFILAGIFGVPERVAA